MIGKSEIIKAKSGLLKAVIFVLFVWRIVHSLACQVNLRRDTEVSKKGDKNISIRPSSFYITCDGDHLIHCKKGGKKGKICS